MLHSKFEQHPLGLKMSAKKRFTKKYKIDSITFLFTLLRDNWKIFYQFEI